MMQQIIFVVAAMVVAIAVASVLKRRKSDAPTQAGFEIPIQVDRNDFEQPHTPWLVAVFTSATCHTCADVATKAEVLSSSEVAVQRIDYTLNPALHKRYRIDAVPLLVIADGDGVVHKGFVGPLKAQDLWAAMAECRNPGSTPESCQSHQ
jgi:Thioredoxin